MSDDAISVLPDDQALEWLRAQPDGQLSASELSRRWSWPRTKVRRRLGAWAAAGLISPATHGRAVATLPATTLATLATAMSNAGPQLLPVAAAAPPVVADHCGGRVDRAGGTIHALALVVAVALGCVSAAFSIDGLASVYAGAFWQVIVMGSALEAGKLVTVAWLGHHWCTAPRPLRAALMAGVSMLMIINAIGVFGFLTRAHLDHALAGDLVVAGHAAEVDARLTVQANVVADLDRRIAQIDAAIEEATRRGRTNGAMALAGEQRKLRSELGATRQREAQALGAVQVEEAKIEGERRRAAADVAPVRYIAELIGGPDADLEHAVQLLTLGLVVVLDPMAILLVIAASSRRRLDRGA